MVAAGRSTEELVARAQGGDPAAREALFRRYRPRLERLVHGHLPRNLCGANDTQDIVQNSLCRALEHLDRYDYRHEGAFLAWLRAIVRHVIVDMLRRTHRTGGDDLDPDRLSSAAPSPLQQAIGVDDIEIYERALGELPEPQRHAVIMRLEYEMSFASIATALQMPSTNAARMMVHRASERLAKRMRELGSEP